MGSLTDVIKDLQTEVSSLKQHVSRLEGTISRDAPTQQQQPNEQNRHPSKHGDNSTEEQPQYTVLETTHNNLQREGSSARHDSTARDAFATRDDSTTRDNSTTRNEFTYVIVLQHVLKPQNVMAVNTAFQDQNAVAYYMLGTPVHSETQMVSLVARSTAEHTFSAAEVTLGRLLSLYID